MSFEYKVQAAIIAIAGALFVGMVLYDILK